MSIKNQENQDDDKIVGLEEYLNFINKLLAIFVLCDN